MRKKMIAVIGGGEVDEQIRRQAHAVGRLIAEQGAVVVTGGLGGVMEAACKGAREAGGETIGILPGSDAAEANPYVTLPIVTGMSEARNAIIARTAQALIAVGGEYGTLSEIAFGLKFGKRVISLHSWGIFDEMLIAESPDQAVALALQEGAVR